MSQGDFTARSYPPALWPVGTPLRLLCPQPGASQLQSLGLRPQELRLKTLGRRRGLALRAQASCLHLLPPSRGKGLAGVGGWAPGQGCAGTVSCREPGLLPGSPLHRGVVAWGTLPGRGAISEDFLEKVLSKQPPGGMCQAKGRVQGSRWRGQAEAGQDSGRGECCGRGWGAEVGGTGPSTWA